VAKSKLFTPGSVDHDCFVNPFTGPTGPNGFAPTDKGGAAYPLKLNGGGGSMSLQPAKQPSTTSHDRE
jgi:hypothetical protein